jgi:hypothetical protein
MNLPNWLRLLEVDTNRYLATMKHHTKHASILTILSQRISAKINPSRGPEILHLTLSVWQWKRADWRRNTLQTWLAKVSIMAIPFAMNSMAIPDSQRTNKRQVYEKRQELESLASFPAGRKSDPCDRRRQNQVEVLYFQKAGAIF